MSDQWTWQRYEAALLERLTQQFRPRAYDVCGTRGTTQHRVLGRYSGWRRQLDAAVYRAGDKTPFLVADAKRYQKRKIGVPDVERFMGLLDDIGCEWGAMASPLGPTEPARRRSASAGITLDLMTYADALEAEWFVTAREIYPWDWAFHPQLASGLLAMNQGGPAEEVVDALGDVAFEEWQNFVRYALLHHREEAAKFLAHIANEHWDDGWRYNAVQFLLDEGLLADEQIQELRNTERDPAILDLLAE